MSDPTIRALGRNILSLAFFRVTGKEDIPRTVSIWRDKHQEMNGLFIVDLLSLGSFLFTSSRLGVPAAGNEEGAPSNHSWRRGPLEGLLCWGG